jgi:glyoxylate/hydroxypyruvate reductase A
MALLIYGLDTDEIGTAQSWRDTLAELLPHLEIRIFPDVGNTSDITYLAFMRPDFDAIPPLPNLRAMFSRSAGVEAFINHPKLPQAPLGKIEPAGGDPMMTEYVLMHVLSLHREMPRYQEAQANREWLRRPIRRPEQRRIGFLGLGLMAKAPALVLKSLGFPVSAWVRSPREEPGIPVFHGPDQLEPFLRQADIVVCLLPLTRETEGILCARTFAMMPRGAMVINIGRGKHVVDADLVAALESGQLSYAALDALHRKRRDQTLLARERCG